MKAKLDGEILIGGPTLAAAAVSAGLVDEYHLFVFPVAVGGGLRYLPERVRLNLRLIEEHTFTSGVVYLKYEADRE